MIKQSTVTYTSSSDPSITHEVVVVAGQIKSCTCKGWAWRRTCRHAQQAARDLGLDQYKVTVLGGLKPEALGPFTKPEAWKRAKRARTRAAHTITISRLGGVMGGDEVVYTLAREGRRWVGYKPGDREDFWAALDAA